MRFNLHFPIYFCIFEKRRRDDVSYLFFLHDNHVNSDAVPFEGCINRREDILLVFGDFPDPHHRDTPVQDFNKIILSFPA